jgi:hypothetical protein
MIASGYIRWLRVIVGFLEEAIDGRLQIANRTKCATLEALPAQLGEEAFDRIEPGGRGRGEVKDEAGMPAQPGPAPWDDLWIKIHRRRC